MCSSPSESREKCSAKASFSFMMAIKHNCVLKAGNSVHSGHSSFKSYTDYRKERHIYRLLLLRQSQSTRITCFPEGVSEFVLRSEQNGLGSVRFTHLEEY
jgi:hypothetical protein